ncbi:MAG: 2,3,4,5-tetrahydropyridine-2,6-dicarboxylate N-succinyltransferase [Enterobacteriaceae bacterium]
MDKLKKISNFLHKDINKINKFFPNIKDILKIFLKLLQLGKIRVSEKINKKWKTNKWIIKCILLCMKIFKTKSISLNKMHFFDKLYINKKKEEIKNLKKKNIRIAPLAIIRKGVHISKNSVIMPSYINIGAFIDEGTMIDTWSTIGSCAQIGKKVHISGGVGIGGILEPIQKNPTIIEDYCFIGARSEIAEGVIIEKGSVISMGVFISKSTKIYDRNEKRIYYGKVPKNSVVVPGSLPSNDKNYNLNCAVIVKKVDNETKKKIIINNLLREKTVDVI